MEHRLAVFDMDGTILDTLDDLADSVNFALLEAGYPGRSREEVRSFVGNGLRKLIERSVPQDVSGQAVDGVHASFAAHYKAHCMERTKPYAGILGLLQTLRQAGWKTAVASNKADDAVQALCRVYFSGLFDAAVGERPGIRRKPEPDGVNEILKQLDCPPACAVYIGDSEVDIQTAQNAGIESVIVDWGFRDRQYLAALGAQRIASSPESLLELLMQA